MKSSEVNLLSLYFLAEYTNVISLFSLATYTTLVSIWIGTTTDGSDRIDSEGRAISAVISDVFRAMADSMTTSGSLGQ